MGSIALNTSPQRLAPDAAAPVERLTNTERKILTKLRAMRERRRNCMIIIRVDGSAVQILDASPSDYITES